MAVLGNMNACLKDLTIVAEDAIQETQPMLHPLICSEIPEDGMYTRIPVPANMAMPRKWEGERKAVGKDVPVTEVYEQDTYELTLDFKGDFLSNATAITWSDLIREAVMSAKLFPSYLMSQMVIHGADAGSLAYDKNPFYGDTHVYAGVGGAPNIDNTIAGTGVTIPALATDLATAVARLRTYQDNAGRLLNPLTAYGQGKLLVHCPAALDFNFDSVLRGSTIPIAVGSAAVTGDNVSFKSIADKYADGYLDAASVSRWYLHYTAMPQKPFVFIENYGLQLDVLGYGTEFNVNTGLVRVALKHRFVLGMYRFDRSMQIG